MNLLLMLLFVPVAALGWRIVASKSRWPRKAGAAAAAMLTLVGAAASENAPSETFLTTMRIINVRDAIAVLAASSGSLYLLWWASSHRGRAMYKTVSIVAAILGLVPIIGAVANAILYGR